MDFRVRFPSRLWRPSVPDEVDGELEFHLEMREREFLDRGMTPAEARRAALDRFGDVHRVRRECRAIGTQRERRMRAAEYLSEFRQDVVFALRHMAAAPVFTIVALLTLSVAIGATTAIFSAVHAVVLRPLPVREPERLFTLSVVWRGLDGPFSVGNFVDMAEEQRSFEAVGAYGYASFNLGTEGSAERLVGLRVIGDYFGALGVGPLLGRTLTPADDAAERASVAVISHRLWMRAFGGDPGVVGREIRLSARTFTVIGVMPASFDWTLDSEELWVPFGVTPRDRAQHDEHWLYAVGRLKEDVTVDRAQQDLQAIGVRLRDRFPNENAERSIRAVPLMETFVGSYRQRLLLLLGAVGLVLLIACGNVANLLLARGSARMKELALRSALGAGQARLVRQLLTESVVLSILAAALGLILAHGLVKAIVAFGPSGVPRLEQTRIDGAVLLFTIAVALASSLVFGLAPAWRAARTDIGNVMKDGGRGTSTAGKEWIRSLLIASEVGMAVVLLVSAGLLIRSAIELQGRPTGFALDSVLTARVTLPAEKYAQPERVTQALDRIVSDAARLPGVRFAAVSNAVPMASGGFSNGVILEGRPLGLSNAIETWSRFVSPDYLPAMGISVLRGRGFTARDDGRGERVAIVNETLARNLDAGRDPVGMRFTCCGAEPDGSPMWWRIVGVAADVRALGPAAPVVPEIYIPLRQAPDAAFEWMQRTVYVVVRADGNPVSLVPALRRIVTAIDSDVPLFAAGTMRERLARASETARFNTLLLTCLALTGLLLSAVGIYGLIAYFVSQRTPEIGVRMALGASRGAVVLMTLRQAATPVIAGTTAGILGAFFAVRLLAAELVDVRPSDPLTFSAVVATLLAVALVSALIPARRAAGLDPARALLR
jgi:predicted permease